MPKYCKFIPIVFCLFGMLSITSCATVELRPDKNTGMVFRDTFISGKSGPEMVWVPAGTFYMGATYSDEDGESDEYPRHAVDMPQPFAVAKYETTVAEFREFVFVTKYLTEAEKTGGCHAYKKWWYTHADISWRVPGYEQQENFPVVCVSWNDAVAYTKWLSDQTGKNYRLPTEAEWEYVVRSGTKTRYWWGDTGDCLQANCNAFKAQWLHKQSNPVGSFKSNAFGIYDMTGNVWEWVSSEYMSPYDGNELVSSDKAAHEGLRGMRGGSWYNWIVDLRSSNRATRPPTEGWSTVGFRVIREN